MSKMVDALNKAQKFKDQTSETPNEPKVHGGEDKFFSSFSNIALIMTLIVVVLLSVLMSWRTSMSLNKSQKATVILSKNIVEQKNQINDLQEFITLLGSSKGAQVSEIKRQLKDLKVVVKQTEREISDVAIDYNILKVLVDDINVTNQELIDRFVGISEEIQELKDMKQKQVKIHDLLQMDRRIRKE